MARKGKKGRTRSARWHDRLFPRASDYRLTRFLILRVLGLVYFFAFLSLATQFRPLLGSEGLLPAGQFLERVSQNLENRAEAFWRLPTLFWLHDADGFMLALAWLGVAVSLAVLLGFANMPLLFALWAVYLSFVAVGQTWYGYGWEIQLLETGFLAIFLVPLWDARPFPKTAPPAPVIWLFRWLAFRIYLGAGLIKWRGDECWRALTCLDTHFETQPIPNPLSPLFHYAPPFAHKLGVLLNHAAELLAPFFVFWPRVLRLGAGVLFLGFQLILILSGNLSFLNWVTIVPGLACFDDAFLRRFLPRWLVSAAMPALPVKAPRQPAKAAGASTIAAYALLVLVAVLSWPVVTNLLSSRQIMNTSFNQWHLVNTYGAFGSVGEVRLELIVEGSADGVEWKAYEFPFKAGNLTAPLPVVAPYQPRVAWQIWFAAMQRPEQNPWLIHLLWKLLHNDPVALQLVSRNPFPDAPPAYVRVEWYRYRFAPLGSNRTWERERLGTWLPPLRVEDLEPVIAATWPESVRTGA